MNCASIRSSTSATDLLMQLQNLASRGSSPWNTRIAELTRRISDPTFDKRATHLKDAERLLRTAKTWSLCAPDLPDAMKDLPDQVDFVVRSRLIFSIKGQRSVSQDPSLCNRHVIERRGDDLCIRCKPSGDEDAAISVKTLIERFSYDAAKQCLIDREGRSWNYFQDGLEQVDRWEGSDFRPVAQISTSEQRSLLQEAKKFWDQPVISGNEISRDPQSTSTHTSVIQIFMCPRGVKRNARKAGIPVHAAIRIIDEQGRVYSTGFGSTLEEDKHNEGWGNLLTAINGMPTLMDYEEFRQDDGRVTVSLSVSSETKDRIIAQLDKERKETIRFQILRQNCTRLATHVLQMAGVRVQNQCNALVIGIAQFLPAPLGNLLESVARLWSKLHPAVRVPLAVLMSPLWLCYQALAVAFILCRGGAKGSTPPADGIRTDDDLERFHGRLSSPLDYLKDPFQSYHSTPLMRWMLVQPTVCAADYQGCPDMRLHASQHNPKSLRQLRRAYRVSARILQSRSQVAPPAAEACSLHREHRLEMAV